MTSAARRFRSSFDGVGEGIGEGIGQSPITPGPIRGSGAEMIVTKEAKSFRKWHRNNEESEISRSLIKHFNVVKEEVLAVNSHKMSEKEFKRVDKITSLLVKRLLHHPLSFLKNDDGPHREMLLKKGVLNKLFGLQNYTNDR